MRTIGLPQLTQRRDVMEQQKERYIANVNATVGAINLLNEFIEEETAAEQALVTADKKD